MSQWTILLLLAFLWLNAQQRKLKLFLFFLSTPETLDWYLCDGFSNSSQKMWIMRKSIHGFQLFLYKIKHLFTFHELFEIPSCFCAVLYSNLLQVEWCYSLVNAFVNHLSLKWQSNLKILIWVCIQAKGREVETIFGGSMFLQEGRRWCEKLPSDSAEPFCFNSVNFLRYRLREWQPEGLVQLFSGWIVHPG